MSPSQRVRVRIGARDRHTLADIATRTALDTRSAAVRGALQLAREASEARAAGFALQVRRPGGVVRPFEGPAPGGRDEPREQWLELRLGPDHAAVLDALVANGFAADRSAAVRAALALLEAAALACGDEGILEAVSAGGERLHLRVPGLGARELPDAAEHPPAGAVTPGPRLPASVLREVEALAEEEDCPVDVMLADLVRTALGARGAASPADSPGRRQPAAAAGVFDFGAAAPSERSAEARRMEPRRPAANLPAVARVEEHAWGLVLVGRDGETEGRVVRPDAVLPLDPEDLEPPSGN